MLINGCRNLACGVAVALALIAGPSAAAERVRALIPVKTIDESIAPFVVAKYLGYYKDEGLDVDLLAVGGSNEVAIQVAAGNGDLGEATPAQAVIGMQEGAAAPLDVKYFYDAGYRNIWSISVPAESAISSIAQLRGKKIGVTALGSAGITYGKAYLRSAGLNPDTDVTFVAIGAGSQALVAVKQKLVDAIVFWDAANIRFELNGLALKALPIDQKLASLPDVSLLAKTAMIRDNPKPLVGFARAVAKALDFTLANPVAAVLITWKLYPEGRPHGVDADAAVAQGLKISQTRMAGWTDPETNGKHGLFIESGWKNLDDFLLEEKQIAKPVPTSRMYTNALIDQINDYDRDAIVRQAHAFDLSSVR